MSKSSIEKEKLEIIKWVTNLKDSTAIERLKMLRESPPKSDWWNEISEEELQAEERFNEKLDSLEDPLDIQERLNRTLFQRDQLIKERDEWIRINHKNQERINVLEEQIQKIQTEDEQKKKRRSPLRSMLCFILCVLIPDNLFLNESTIFRLF